VRRFDVAALGTPRNLARLGVVVCIVVTLSVAIRWLVHDALPGQDHWASLNSSQTYAQRTFPPDEFIGSGTVAEDARLWMPRSSTYRILVGTKYENTAWGFAAPHFLEGFLFPRHRIDSSAAQWVICLGCDIPSLGGHFRVLSDGGNGVVFGKSAG
jgi:hypothetical protein